MVAVCRWPQNPITRVGSYELTTVEITTKPGMNTPILVYDIYIHYIFQGPCWRQ